jgi:aldose 1-epimerase
VTSATRESFGVLPDGRIVDIVTLCNANGMTVRFLTHGGIIVSLTVPDRNAVPGDVVLGYDTLECYLADHAYMGALIGRYANRIANGRFPLDGVTYMLPRNDGPNQLHGGPHGFNTMLWDLELVAARDHARALLRHVSPAGDSGYPGTLAVQVTYTLAAHNTLIVDYAATADQATPVNFTQHSYFNLTGHDAGDILGHELMVRASRFTPVDEHLIPTGEIRAVHGTPFDFTRARTVGARINADDPQLRFARGYDHNLVLDSDAGASPSFAAALHDPISGRTLTVHSTEPGLHVYSGNHLGSGPPGKGGHRYAPRSGMALETQHFPDSPNHTHFPSTILRPGVEFHSRSEYRFSLDAPEPDRRDR